MAINFPTSLDALTNPLPTDPENSVTVPHARQHSDVNDAVEALEAKVGIDSSAVTSSHDYKIAANASAITSEATARAGADTTLQGNINAEASTRASADTSEASSRVSGDAASVATAASDATTKANAAQAAAIAASLPLHATADDSAELAGTVPTAYGLSLIDDTDATAARATLGLGTLATQSGTFSGTSSGTNTGDQTDISGNAGTCDLADDSTKLAGVTPSAGGLSILDDTDATAMRATLGLGTLATQSGTFSGTSSGTNTGDQSSIVGITGTLSEFNNALTGADFATGGGTVTGASSGTNTGDQTSVSGNAATATALQTARTINGVSFDGTANIVVTAAAGTLSGTTLAAGVTASSLTSFGNSPTLVTPDIGTPSAGVATNLSGTASSLTAGHVTTNANLTGPITSSGNATAIASQTGTGTKFVMDTSPALVTPDLGTPTALVGTNISGTAASLTAGHVTTNANLTGPITSVGNATSVAAQTGTGSTFVMNTSPTLVTPLLGTPTSGVITNLTGNARGAIVTSRLDAATSAISSHTGDTNETTLVTFNIAAGHGLTAGSIIKVYSLWSLTNNANNKGCKIKLGATNVFNIATAMTSFASWQKEILIYVRSTTSQVVFATNSTTSFGTSGTAIATLTEDISGAFTITLLTTLGNTGDTVSVEHAAVQFAIL